MTTTKRPPKTVKEKRWVKKYIEIGSGSEAAKQVYDVTSDDSARAIASQNFQKIDMSSIMDAKGLTDERLVDVLDDGLQAEKVIMSPTEPDRVVKDYAIRHKYLETALKLKGKLQPASNQTNVQINTVIPIIGLEPYVPGDNSNSQDIPAQEEN